MRRLLGGLLTTIAAVVGAGPAQAQSWQPTQPVQLVVPAGTGGGADQMARVVAELVAKHKLIITLSSLFTVPMAAGIDFNWRQLTPVAMLALDPFVV